MIAALALSCDAADVSDITAIKTSFDPDGVLSKNELKTVVKLAGQCGISKAVEVYTYKRHPTSQIGIGVKSAETIKGRNISFVTVRINSEKLPRRTKEEPNNIVKSSGKYWVSRGGIQTNTYTTFAGKGASIRVHLENNISIALADRIVAAFVAGKINYADEKTKEKLRHVDLSKPESLGSGVEKNKFGVSFSSGPFCTDCLDCTLDEKGVTIYSMYQIIS